jgi:hypothetical protein
LPSVSSIADLFPIFQEDTMKANREADGSIRTRRVCRLLLCAGLAICLVAFSSARAEAATVRFHNRSGVQVRIESKYPNGANGPSVTIANGKSGTISFRTYSLRVRAVATGGSLGPSGWHMVTSDATRYVKKKGPKLTIEHHP